MSKNIYSIGELMKDQHTFERSGSKPDRLNLWRRYIRRYTELVFYSIMSFWMVSAYSAEAQVISLEVEALVIENVGAAWVPVDTENSYSDPVIACVYNLPSSASSPAVVRVRNASTTGFEVRVQKFEDSNDVTASAVHCMVVDAGVHTLEDGRKLEAFKVLSDQTNGKSIGWQSSASENVTSLISHTYTTMVVLGQVMTFNDTRASAFWTHNCSNRGVPPQQNAFCVGKHIGKIAGSRAPEELGVIIVDEGAGVVNGVNYNFALGPNSIAGVGSNPPYSYNLNSEFETAIAIQSAENGGDGGWAVLYGNAPVGTNLMLAIDEETAAGSTTRAHIPEQVAFAAFKNHQVAQIETSKSVDTFGENTSNFALPGEDVVYTLSVENLGTAAIDSDSIFLVDTLSDQFMYFHGDADGSGPETASILFNGFNSDLELNQATGVRYSDSISKPTNFEQCSYVPAAGYDAAVRHICFMPEGRMNSGSLFSASKFEIKYRGRIR